MNAIYHYSDQGQLEKPEEAHSQGAGPCREISSGNFPPFNMLPHGNLLEAANVKTFNLVIVLKGVENY